MAAQKKSIKSLLCLLQGLQTYETTVELRNEIIVEGRIDHVDERMNTVITGATYKLLDGSTRKFDELFIQGSQIRYIPKEIDVMSLIGKQIQRVHKMEEKPPLYSKQRLTVKKRERINEEKKMVREFLMGKGREHDNK